MQGTMLYGPRDVRFEQRSNENTGAPEIALTFINLCEMSNAERSRT